jgi:hypothetical protein
VELYEQIAAIREVILERGWCKRNIMDSEGRVCLRGAEGIVTDKNPTSWRADEPDRFLSELAEQRGFSTAPYGGAHVAFNNHSDTTEQDVIDFLNEAEIAAKELAAASR